MAQGSLLNWTVTFLIIAIIAALLGFGGLAEDTAGIAKILFGIFLIFFIISLFTGALASTGPGPGPYYGGGYRINA